MTLAFRRKSGLEEYIWESSAYKWIRRVNTGYICPTWGNKWKVSRDKTLRVQEMTRTQQRRLRRRSLREGGREVRKGERGLREQVGINKYMSHKIRTENLIMWILNFYFEFITDSTLKTPNFKSLSKRNLYTRVWIAGRSEIIQSKF